MRYLTGLFFFYAGYYDYGMGQNGVYPRGVRSRYSLATIITWSA
jgi:hypothetical protein